MPARAALQVCFILAAAAGCAPVDTRGADALSATGELVALSGGGAGARFACQTCHGLDGMGNGSDAPRLAGLDAGYLERQLLAYADGRRRHAPMQWVARHLDANERKQVAGHYAQMAVAETPPGAGMPPPPLWTAGDPGRGLVACAACHGIDGQGKGSANPPLAGQPAPYLAGQMHQWRKGLRRSDPGDVMLRISQRLTPSEIDRLSTYAGNLAARPSSRERREASP